MAQIAMVSAISRNRPLQPCLHESDETFGSRPDAGGLTSNLVPAISLMHKLGMCRSILDYGTGKGRLVKHLRSKLPNNILVNGFDPAVDRWLQKPSHSFDILTCLDVLEHVEPESIDAVFSDIKALTNNFCFLIIDLQPAIKRLSDGRNAHVLLAPCDWWISRVSQHFTSGAAFPLLHTIGSPQKLVVAASSNPAVSPYVIHFQK